MRKLLQINVAANWGSHGRIAEGIGEVALSEGWESYIAYGRYANPSRSNLIKVGGTFNPYIHGAESLLFDRHGLGSKGATWHLIQEVEYIQPDVIHLHNIHGYYLNYPVLFDYLANLDVPVVWTLHDAWPVTGHCAFFDSVHCEKWKSHCSACPKQKSYPASFFLDRSERNFELKRKCFTALRNLTLVPVSDWLDGVLADSFLKDVPRVRIHNGIDTSQFQPSGCEASFCPGKKVVLGVNSVWEARKGLADFLALRERLDDQYEIVLIGLTKKQIACLPEGITGIRRTDSIQSLAGYYTRADVFVNPTYEDNFPTTNLEAMACGTPVITYLTGGSPEAVTPDTGLVVPTGDLGALVTAVQQVCQQPFSPDACRERVVRHFRKDDRFQEYFRLYIDLINRQQA